MKRFACGDVIPGCETELTGETEDEVLDLAVQHARRDHGMTTIPDDVLVTARGLIRDE